MFISRFDSPAAVASEAGVTLARLEDLIAAKPRLFTELRMKKRRPGAGDRIVYKVHPDLRAIHRKIAIWLRDSWTPRPCVHGFRKHRSIVSHATPHCGKEIVVTADIMDFFPSISAEKVRGAFLVAGANDAVAQLLTNLGTYEGSLPAGTRCSPEIANVVCRELDDDFTGSFPSYTRYADDMAFSGSSEAVPTAQEVFDTLARHDFTLREGSFFSVAGPRHRYVTGLLVDHKHGPHVDRATKRALRAEVYYIAKYGLEDHCQRAGISEPERRLVWLIGKLNQLSVIEPKFAKPLLRELPFLRPQDVYPDEDVDGYLPDYGDYD